MWVKEGGLTGRGNTSKKGGGNKGGGMDGGARGDISIWDLKFQTEINNIKIKSILKASWLQKFPLRTVISSASNERN